MYVQVGDKDCGYLFELFLIKLCYVVGCGDFILDFFVEGWINLNIKWSIELQIVGMSVMMFNVFEVVKWFQVFFCKQYYFILF